MSETTIRVEVAGSEYSLRVKTEDEVSIKEAVELINNKLAEFERTFAIKDKKEVMGMVMLQLVAQLYKQATSAEQELSHLKSLFTDVETMLKQHQRDIDSITGE